MLSLRQHNTAAYPKDMWLSDIQYQYKTTIINYYFGMVISSPIILKDQPKTETRNQKSIITSVVRARELWGVAGDEGK